MDLALLYPLVKEFPEAPLSINAIATGFARNIEDVRRAFEEWQQAGLVIKKYHTVEVYMLTPKGYDHVVNDYLQNSIDR